MVASTSAAAAYMLPSLVKFGSPLEELVAIVLIVAMDTAAAALICSKTFLFPLSKLSAGSNQAATRNLKSVFYSGVISKGLLAKSDELSRALMAFELMRRKIVQLQNDLVNSDKQRGDIQDLKDALIQKEAILQRANAKLVGQHDDLQKINEELSSKNIELSQANERLQKLDKMKSDFILIAAHELRTPIQPILGSIQVAKRGLLSSEEAWESIEVEAKRLSNVANYILDVGKIESGTFICEMKPIAVKSLIEGVISSSSKLASGEDVIIITKEVDDDDMMIKGDKQRLLQAFGNIVGNAARFAKNGTITIKAKPNTEKNLVEIRIIDDGPGIPAEIMPLLFSKFVTKTQENERGTGLGLFITKSIIEVHGGIITASNNSANGGKGATFTISLPMLQEGIAAAQRRTS
jgi:signal transduction histidine kinase